MSSTNANPFSNEGSTSAAVLEAVLGASPAVLVVVNAEGRLLFASEEASRMSGYTQGELLALPIVALLPETSHERASVVVREFYGEPRAMVIGHATDIHVRRKDGGEIPVELSLRPLALAGKVYLLAAITDISVRREAERALRVSQEKFHRAFTASPHAITLSDMVTGRYIEVNDGFERITGYTRAEAVGRTSLEMGMWKNPEERIALVRRLIADGRVRDFELNFIDKAGRQLIVRNNSETVTIDGRLCLVSLNEDITARRAAEVAKAEIEGQLRQAQKLEALGQLAGGIAHDFNNILTAILAYAELTGMDAEKPEEVRKHVTQVRAAGGRAKELVKRILAFSRQQQPERKPVRLQAVVLEALTLLRSTLPSTIEIETRIDEGAPVTLADAAQIHQVMMNLCTNAAHAMGGQPGRMTVALECAVIEAGMHAELRAGRHARLMVSDTGCGMRPDVLKRIFEPFFTTKGPTEGTGLGLPVVHGIVRDHDGAITVESRVNEGTTFRVFFPEHADATMRQSEKEDGKSALPRGRGERILFVDDERVLCDAGRRLLEYLGYAPVTFADAEEALRRFRHDPADFDLVITDLTMPHMTGLDLAMEIAALRPELPVLLASGFSGTWTAEKVKALGLRDLIAKPVSVEVLAAAVRRALDER
ncbi:hybrid sensor histidine kinase/response regulator [Nibricoccus aquaticus]|uniref:histidine kinase n=1 Tax=Nibricoccus aquaticus TaxID=2576891 RepID=A0A290Q4A9_9BACT|nr:PAS domain-containing sensor histidine kinase [Nibricoccus aquaticus]ATC63509.1 hybrid sensor histidine kinase/response regulator [Nibricoccus aquaticus]